MWEGNLEEANLFFEHMVMIIIWFGNSFTVNGIKRTISMICKTEMEDIIVYYIDPNPLKIKWHGYCMDQYF